MGVQVLVRGGSRKTTEPIDCHGESGTIGKSDQNLVVLQGWSIAPMHARLEQYYDG